jgi:hypothetical protein
MSDPNALDLSAAATAANLVLCGTRCQGQFQTFTLPGDPRVTFDSGFIPMSGARVYGLPDAQRRLVAPGPTGGTTVGWNAVYRSIPMALYCPCDPNLVALGQALVLWFALQQFDIIDRATPLIEGSGMPPPR